ncbi:uncharacterized protein BDR25DRAFT_56839 [Lindgomyces ingoldianus]|uniref:Uncharacterized protein n=1 Tax=Lindgomyces ingoldianus TaxID=673940 RepID=A0ACB6QNB8_9PLEO|nr:uncharacterized protein BDR25DRAFT_56839 [Lindgomyces ingoldianus]KAF2468390.1 hypothetical protein BDR25DRAFT_56839 [Lindgomyces ingoldianus]
MQLFKLIAVVTATILSTTEACKCLIGGSSSPIGTHACCNQIGGNFQFGDDCQASSIANSLSSFHSCCRGIGGPSDCGCPSGCI